MAEQSTRRFFKSHFPFLLLPRNITKVGAKIVYVARNPRDVAVSWYYLHKMHPLVGFSGDFECFVKLFMDGMSKFNSLFNNINAINRLILAVYGPYWQHVLKAWSHRNEKNVFFMFYEDLKVETEKTIRNLSTFLGKPISDDALPKLLEYLKFENFKANSQINFKMNEEDTDNNSFVRRGKIGGNPEISNEMSKKFDVWIEENLNGTDLQFPHCTNID